MTGQSGGDGSLFSLISRIRETVTVGIGSRFTSTPQVVAEAD
jgi:hypothetical protein